MWYKNIAGRFFGLVTTHVCDRQMDGQSYDSQDCAGIAALRGNKCATTQNKHKKTKAKFSHLLRHPTWKRTGPNFILALHKFVT